jgi:signal transduction histidine kinase
MGGRGLKSKIAVNITVFLLLGMLSINLVTMMTAQHNLIRAESGRAAAAAAWVSRWLADHLLPAGDEPLPAVDAELAELLSASGAACLFAVDRAGREYLFGGGRCGFPEEVSRLARQAASGAPAAVGFLGSTFGLIRPENKFLVVSGAVRGSRGPLGGFCLVYALEPIYQSLRASQKILFLYIFLNTAVLAFLGIYRVFKLYLQPLARLAKRAEDYKDEGELLFLVRKEDNELQRLSTALNGLMGRLCAEKEKLRATVASLEAANAELTKAQQEMIRAEKLASVGRLSAGIAHEIGNPLGIVTGYLELLKQPDISREDRDEYLSRTLDEVERINAIIRQLLEISRPSRAGSRRVSVHALLDDMARVLEIQPLMSPVRLYLDLKAENDLCACDDNQLRQVFLNLVINAADAIRTGGPGAAGDLVVATENSNGNGPGAAAAPARRWLNVRFSDNGPGIPEAEIANVFDPFYTTKEPGKGTGLGLSVSFMIVQSFGGRIHAESAAGRGTTMTVCLPVLEPEETTP